MKSIKIWLSHEISHSNMKAVTLYPQQNQQDLQIQLILHDLQDNTVSIKGSGVYPITFNLLASVCSKPTLNYNLNNNCHLNLKQK